MSVQVKGSGTIGGLDEGLEVVGIVTATTFDGNLTGNVTGDITISDSIIHSGDNSKIRFPSNDTITFETSGNEGVRIDAGGRLLVGTNAARTFGGSVYAHLQIEGTTQQGSQLTITRNTNDTYAPNITLCKTRGTSDGAVTTVQDNDSLGTIQFRGADGSDVFAVAATIAGEVDGSPSDGTDMPGALTFATTADGAASPTERIRITSEGKVGVNETSPSAYARVHVNDANGVLLSGNGQSRILMRNNTGGTNEKMMDIQCNGNINFRTINDNYTTATTRATFRTDGNFVVGNRVGTSSPSTNQPVAFHSARITPDTASSTLSNGVRCNLYVGSNGGWAAGDGGVIGMGGSRAGYAGQEAMWAYIKGSRISSNGWEYAGKMELGTAEWGTYNTTKAVTIYADNQIDHHGKDNTMYSASIGGAVRVRLQHNGGGNMTISNPSSGNFTFDTNSDYRLKEDVVNITNALTTVKALKPYQYKWKHDGKLGQGFIAHEAQEVLPDVGIVSGTKDAVHAEDDPEKGHWKKDDPIYQGIDYSKLVPLLTAALQEETAKREALEARVAALEGS